MSEHPTPERETPDPRLDRIDTTYQEIMSCSEMDRYQAESFEWLCELARQSVRGTPGATAPVTSGDPTDTERLDWLQAEIKAAGERGERSVVVLTAWYSGESEPDGYSVESGELISGMDEHPTLREAIDAFRSASSVPETP